ncbi:MAG: CooT family nickel-binding protein [Methanobacteriaceae archaeon]
MCESNVYTTENELLMEDVMEITINGEEIEMIDILGQKKTVNGKFTKLDLEGHKLYLELI